MALPKFRKSKSRTMMRRTANDKRKLPNTSLCVECGQEKLPHRICPDCTTYKGKPIIQKKT